MKPVRTHHLSEEEIVVAVVDPADLAPARRDHLYHCHHCENARRLLERGLARFGECADQHTPPAPGPRSLPDRSTRISPRGWSWAWRGISAVAAAALVVMVVNLWPQHEGNGPLHPSRLAEKEPVEAERLVSQVNALVENSLPAPYVALTGGEGSLLDDELMDFIVPPVTEEVSYFYQRRGHVPC